MESDGNFVLADGQTSVEFIIPADVISTLNDGGLGFMVCNVIVKSAEITKADAPQGAIKLLTAEEGEQVTVGTYGAEPAEETAAAPEETTAAPVEADDEAAADDADKDEAPAEEAAAPAETEPAADTAVTTSAATGNVSAAAMISVLAVAGVAAIAAKKRK